MPAIWRGCQRCQLGRLGGSMTRYECIAAGAEWRSQGAGRKEKGSGSGCRARGLSGLAEAARLPPQKPALQEGDEARKRYPNNDEHEHSRKYSFGVEFGG